MKTTETKQMKETQYKYGETVIEFFKYDQSELQPLLDDAEHSYHARAEGLTFTGKAAQVEFKRFQPLPDSFAELHELMSKGFTVKYAAVTGMDFNIVLRKPEKTIAAELAAIHMGILDQYEADRYARNLEEQNRQIQITLDRKKREAEKAAAEVQAKIDTEKAAVEAAERAAALKDLLDVYSK